MRVSKLSLAALIVLGVTQPSLAANPTCNGLTPTITGTGPGAIQGTSGNDVILVNGTATGTTALPTVVYADAGDDVICLSGNFLNVVIGGAGTDLVSYEHSTQNVVASMNTAALRLKFNLTDPIDPSQLLSRIVGISPGVDLLPTTELLIGSPQNDVLIGNVLAADTIRGGAGDDIIVGLFGNDILYGEDGNDVLMGDGYDEFVYGPFGGFNVGTVPVPRIATDNDILDGGAGNDGLNDDTGNNRFIGGPGDDSFSQGYGNDFLDGGPGSDDAHYAQRPAKVDLRVSFAQDTLHGFDTLVGVENLYGSDRSDTLIGVEGIRNMIFGESGDDFIAGRSFLVGDAVFDRLDGGNGTDACFGATQFNCETTWTPPAPPAAPVPIPAGQEPPAAV